MSYEDNLDPDSGLTSVERELEAALRTLRPAPARINPVAAALAAGRRTVNRQKAAAPWRRWQLAAAAAAVVVAAGAWLTLGPRRQAPDDVVPQAPLVAPNRALATNAPAKPQTLIVYRQALARSPSELNELLDRHATIAREPHNEFTPVNALMLWKTELNSPLGEM
jgi:hypothetical protein